MQIIIMLYTVFYILHYYRTISIPPITSYNPDIIGGIDYIYSNVTIYMFTIENDMRLSVL